MSSLDWLLASDEPGVVSQAKRDLLGEPDPPEAARVLDGRLVRGLLARQQADGGFGVNVYGKWGGAHWRLVSLVELGVPSGEPRCVAAAETVLAWLTGKSHRAGVKTINGLARRCASQEGNALAVCCRLGLAGDPRVVLLAESPGMAVAGRRLELRQARDRPALLVPRVAPADVGLARPGRRHGRADPSLVRHAPLPAFWHYNAFQALLVLSRMGLARDPRAGDAVELLEERRLPDGSWRTGGRWWRPPGSKGANIEIVDWGSGANEMLTLNALRVLHGAK